MAAADVMAALEAAAAAGPARFLKRFTLTVDNVSQTLTRTDGVLDLAGSRFLGMTENFPGSPQANKHESALHGDQLFFRWPEAGATWELRRGRAPAFFGVSVPGSSAMAVFEGALPDAAIWVVVASKPGDPGGSFRIRSNVPIAPVVGVPAADMLVANRTVVIDAAGRLVSIIGTLTTTTSTSKGDYSLELTFTEFGVPPQSESLPSSPSRSATQVAAVGSRFTSAAVTAALAADAAAGPARFRSFTAFNFKGIFQLVGKTDGVVDRLKSRAVGIKEDHYPGFPLLGRHEVGLEGNRIFERPLLSGAKWELGYGGASAFLGLRGSGTSTMAVIETALPDAPSWVVVASRPDDPSNSVRLRPDVEHVRNADYVTVIIDEANRLVSIVISSGPEEQGSVSELAFTEFGVPLVFEAPPPPSPAAPPSTPSPTATHVGPSVGTHLTVDATAALAAAAAAGPARFRSRAGIAAGDEFQTIGTANGVIDLSASRGIKIAEIYSGPLAGKIEVGLEGNQLFERSLEQGAEWERRPGGARAFVGLEAPGDSVLAVIQAALPDVDRWVVVAREPNDPSDSMRLRPESADVADVTVVIDTSGRLVSIVVRSRTSDPKDAVAVDEVDFTKFGVPLEFDAAP